MTYTPHASVLKEESISYLKGAMIDNKKSVYADLTFGAGGHSFAIVEMGAEVSLLSFDQDPDALANGHAKIIEAGFQNRVKLVDSNFVKIKDHATPYLLEQNVVGFNGILMDLGVSSHHFDKGERGFSYRFDAPLDMRMDNRSEEFHTACEVVNELDAEDLTTIFQEYGEERYSRRIAERIVEKRVEKRIETTKDLEDIVFHCYPKEQRYARLNPSTRIFQALRIFVNRELDILKSTLPEAAKLLAPGGVLVVISFHSLEDRIVKHAFKEIASNDECFKIITKKPVLPSEEEEKFNNRARSAKLRVLKRV